MLAHQHSSTSHYSVDQGYQLGQNSESENDDFNTEGSNSFQDDSDVSEQEPGWEDEAMKAGELFYVHVDNDANNVSPSNALNNDSYVNLTPSVTYQEEDIYVYIISEDLSTNGNKLADTLGILSMPTSDPASSESKIVVGAFLPGGVAICSGQVEIGDVICAIDDTPVDRINIDQVLKRIKPPTEMKLSLKRRATFNSFYPIKSTSHSAREETSGIVTKCTTKTISSNCDPSFMNCREPHGIFFLNLDVTSERPKDDEDLLFAYPKPDSSLIASSSKLLSVRGQFITLFDLIQETFSDRVLSSTMYFEEKPIHCVYFMEKTKLLLMCFPGVYFNLQHAHCNMESIVKLLLMMYGSLTNAFNPINQSRNFQLFSKVFSVDGTLSPLSNQKQADFNNIISAMPGISSLTLSNDVEQTIDMTLAEFESNDFVHGINLQNNTKKLYTVISSSLYYEGYLIKSHHNKKDLMNTHLFCHVHGLLNSTKKGNLGMMVVWREYFTSDAASSKTKSKSSSSQFKYEFRDLGARRFLLVIGLKNMLLCTVVQMCRHRFSTNNTPRPDPTIVNFAHASLLHLQGLISNKQSLFPGVSKIKTNPPSLFATPLQSARTSTKQTASEQTGISKSLKLPYSPMNLRKEVIGSDKNKNSPAKSLPLKSPGMTSPKVIRSLFRDKSAGSTSLGSDSAGSPKTEPRGSHSTMNQVEITKSKTITSGNSNVLFSYLTLNKKDSVIVTPAGNELTTPLDHSVISNFTKCIAVLHQRLVSPTDNSDCYEEGMLFESKNQSKSNTGVQYWVVGRLLKSLPCKEFYVCIHESIPQNIVELAFKMHDD